MDCLFLFFGNYLIIFPLESDDFFPALSLLFDSLTHKASLFEESIDFFTWDFVFFSHHFHYCVTIRGSWRSLLCYLLRF